MKVGQKNKRKIIVWGLEVETWLKVYQKKINDCGMKVKSWLKGCQGKLKIQGLKLESCLKSLEKTQRLGLKSQNLEKRMLGKT